MGRVSTKASYGAVSVTTIATKVIAAASGTCRWAIQPTNGTVYYGYDNSVTTLTGLPVAAGQTISEDDHNGDVWAIAGGTVDVRWNRKGV